jgi:hypothetical protein
VVEETTVFRFLGLAVDLVDGPPQATRTTVAPTAATRTRTGRRSKRIGTEAQDPITFDQGRAPAVGDQAHPPRWRNTGPKPSPTPLHRFMALFRRPRQPGSGRDVPARRLAEMILAAGARRSAWAQTLRSERCRMFGGVVGEEGEARGEGVASDLVPGARRSVIWAVKTFASCRRPTIWLRGTPSRASSRLADHDHRERSQQGLTGSRPRTRFMHEASHPTTIPQEPA